MPLLEELIKKQKIELHFHVENLQIHKHSSHQELMIWDFHVMFAKLYVNRMKENVNCSIAQKLRSGEWISNASLGYRHIKAGPRDQGMGKILVDEDLTPLLCCLFEEYTTGAYKLGDMERKAKEWGLTNQFGNKGFLSRAQIHIMAQNPFYYGSMLYKKRNKFFPHKYPPLISKEIFDVCQAVRKGWNKKSFKYGGKDFLFRGLIRCTTTGRLGTANTKKKKYLNGGTGEWTYLLVWNPDNLEKHMLVREEKVILQVEDVFKALKLSTEDLTEVVDYIKSGAEKSAGFSLKTLRRAS